jgi:hypothetical protein
MGFISDFLDKVASETKVQKERVCLFILVHLAVLVFDHSFMYSTILVCLFLTILCVFFPQMTVCDVYNHRIHKVFKNRDSLTSILDRDDIFV